MTLKLKPLDKVQKLFFNDCGRRVDSLITYITITFFLSGLGHPISRKRPKINELDFVIPPLPLNCAVLCTIV